MQETAIQRGCCPRAAVAGGPCELRHAVCVQLGEASEFVTEAADEKGLEEVLRGGSVDLVVVHSSLALHQGGRLLKRLRTLEPPPEIIVFGPGDEAELVEKFEELGASSYLTAWEASDRLLQTVERLMERRGRTQPGGGVESRIGERPQDGAPVDRHQDRRRCSSRFVD